MPRTATESPAPLPETIAGLWSLCALVPFKSRAAYGEAADLCARLSVRRLNAAQREYFRELLAMVEEYEETHKESARALDGLRQGCSARRRAMWLKLNAQSVVEFWDCERELLVMEWNQGVRHSSS